VEIPVPSLAKQKLFEEKISAIKKTRKLLLNALDINDELIASLQNQAFTTGFNA
jgi:hypothetical protein